MRIQFSRQMVMTEKCHTYKNDYYTLFEAVALCI